MLSLAAGEYEDHAPVYRQIALILRERIGTLWKPGDELPSEGELAVEFGVNRNTLRRAIGVLVDEGVLERRRGIRLRVAKLPSLERPKLEADPTQLFRMRPGTEFKVLHFDVQPLGTDAAPLLDLPPGTDAFRIDRLLLAKSEVLAYLVVYVPIDIGRKLRKLDLKHNTITSLLYSTLKVHTRRIRQSIEAALADASIAGALGMPPGTAALRCRYVITDENDRPVQAATYYYAGDRFRLTLEIQTPEPGEATGARRIDSWPLAVTPSSPSGRPSGSRRARR
jgi:DNA-binding GntR family transcriptional regulator